MPINVCEDLPALKILEKEGIFAISSTRAVHQDIRPLKLLILNLMPKKTETEVQLLRLLGNSPLQTEIELLHVCTHVARHTAPVYLAQFYRDFASIQTQKYDGMIITGAPVEQLPFDAVDYWSELSEIMEWSKSHVYSVLHICWGALAGLYYHHGIEKYPLPQKLSGVFQHEIQQKNHPLVRGFDDYFFAPHSRNCDVALQSLRQNPNLEILATSLEAGLYLATTKNGRQVFVLGHGEYDRDTLAQEYFRDLQQGINPQIPAHYFPMDDPGQSPKINWHSHGNLLFANWLNYFVYQQTPYDLQEIQEIREYA